MNKIEIQSEELQDKLGREDNTITVEEIEEMEFSEIRELHEEIHEYSKGDKQLTFDHLGVLAFLASEMVSRLSTELEEEKHG